MTDHLLFTPAEAAARLSISRQQLRKLMASRQLRYVTIKRGRTGILPMRRITRGDLEDFAERRLDAAG